jgi:hypothetical protein
MKNISKLSFKSCSARNQKREGRKSLKEYKKKMNYLDVQDLMY